MRVMTSLAVPLSRSQIEAATGRRDRLPRWLATDRALDALAKHFPGFGLEAALLKVAALNQLYGTNVYAVARMAEHTSRVMAEVTDTRSEAELVEQLAALPEVRDDEMERKHLSFASKFAYFFVDRERFPIYDSYAVETLSYHLHRKDRTTNPAQPYRADLANLATLRSQLVFPCQNRELDRYLWLAGIYRAWKRNSKAQISTEVAKLLAVHTQEVQAMLDVLVPPDQRIVTARKA